MHKTILKTIVGASMLTVLALGWVQPAAAQEHQRQWYESATHAAQKKLGDEIKRDERLKLGRRGEGTVGTPQQGSGGGVVFPDPMRGVPPGGRASYCLSNC